MRFAIESKTTPTLLPTLTTEESLRKFRNRLRTIDLPGLTTLHAVIFSENFLYTVKPVSAVKIRPQPQPQPA